MLEINVRTAHPQDLESVLEIMFGAYSARGYCSKTGAEQYLEENKYALVAEREGEIIGTMLVTYDEGKGTLPTDEYFEEQMLKVRTAASRVAYYGSFAVKTGAWRIGRLSIGLALIREAIDRALEAGIEAAVIIVNPRHVRIYEELGFETKAIREEMPGLGIEGKIPGIFMVATKETFKGVIGLKKAERNARTRSLSVTIDSPPLRLAA